MSDDGHGYDTSSTPMGSGQSNMADRLAALGGRLKVRSAPGQGTIITAHVPLPSAPLPSPPGGSGRETAPAADAGLAGIS